MFGFFFFFFLSSPKILPLYFYPTPPLHGHGSGYIVQEGECLQAGINANSFGIIRFGVLNKHAFETQTVFFRKPALIPACSTYLVLYTSNYPGGRGRGGVFPPSPPFIFSPFHLSERNPNAAESTATIQLEPTWTRNPSPEEEEEEAPHHSHPQKVPAWP